MLTLKISLIGRYLRFIEKKIRKIGLYKGPKFIQGYGIGIFSKFFFSKCAESKIMNFDEDRF